MARHTWVWVAIAALLSASPATAEVARLIPDFGLMLNEDGDIMLATCRDTDPAVMDTKLHECLDGLLDTPVKTLVFNVACGSDIMFYPTQVGSRFGWRRTSKEETKPWSDFMPPLRAAAAAGLDSVQAAGLWTRRHNWYFIPSYRINDSHYTRDPLNNTLTGRFWLENQDLELGESPVPPGVSFKHLLDFEHAEVRAYRLAIMREVIERYADVMDGFQIDLTRQPILFRAGRAEAGMPLLTGMIREVREALDVAGEEQDRYLPLIVRVPPDPRSCAWTGIDLSAWMSERLVDVVIPSAVMTLSHDIPFDAFAAMPGGEYVTFATAVMPRTQYTWPMLASPTMEAYRVKASRESTPAQVRGSVNSALASGARFVEMYNVNFPLEPEGRALVMAAAAPLAGDRVYAVTPSYYLDYTNTYESKKQIPATLSPGESVSVSLHVGEDIDPAAGTPAVLRLGIRGSMDTSSALRIQINGSSLHASPLTFDAITRVEGTTAGSTRHHPEAPEHYLQINLDRPEVMVKGVNRLTLTMEASTSASPLEIVEAQVGVLVE